MIIKILGYAFIFFVVYISAYFIREIIIPFCKIFKDMDECGLKRMTANDTHYLANPKTGFATKMDFSCKEYKLSEVRYMIYDKYFHAKNLLIKPQETKNV